VAKQGYVNLLLNQTGSGDNIVMVKARQLVMSSGQFIPLQTCLSDLVASLEPTSILDAGCGEGYFTRQFIIATNNVVGIDISKHAISHAAKLDPHHLYIVASNYHLPLFDKSVDCLINIMAPHSEEEFSRVSARYIIKVVPNRLHLLEIKQALYDEVILHDAKEVNFPGFQLKKQTTLQYQTLCSDVATLIQMTPYCYTTFDLLSKIPDAPMMTTFDFVLYIYEREAKI